jgi:hypothetical protein
LPASGWEMIAKVRRRATSRLGERGARGHDRQADDDLRHAERLGDAHRAVHEPARPEHEQGDATADRQHVQRHRSAGRVPLLVGLGFTHTEQPRAVDHQHREQQQAVDRSDAAVEAESHRQPGDADHDRHLHPHELSRHEQRHDERRQAEDDQDVEDVAADDVADGEVGRPGGRRLQRHRQLGRTRPEGHDREADDERRDARGEGEPRGAPDQQIASAAEQGEASQDEQDVESHGTSNPAVTA